jgi:tripeptidyl-peptidase-1
VGGTEGAAPERAWSGSSGGFSDRFPRSLSSYQDEAVKTYFTTAGSKVSIHRHRTFYDIDI